MHNLDAFSVPRTRHTSHDRSTGQSRAARFVLVSGTVGGWYIYAASQTANRMDRALLRQNYSAYRVTQDFPCSTGSWRVQSTVMYWYIAARSCQERAVKCDVKWLKVDLRHT
jgi:hypothetical protein